MKLTTKSTIRRPYLPGENMSRDLQSPAGFWSLRVGFCTELPYQATVLLYCYPVNVIMSYLQ